MEPELVETASPLRELAVEYRLVSELKPYPHNARTHSRKQLRQIADSKNGVIAGHGRIEAAKSLGMKTVPTIRLSGLAEAQKRALVIADNKLAENAFWDHELLAQELQALVDFDYDVELTGFETPELDMMLSVDWSEQDPASDGADDIVEPEADAPPVSRTGDLWHLGQHRLYCGDALKPESYEWLLGEEKAQMVFTDPPYNVQIDGHVCGLGSVKHREFAMASGEMSEKEFTAFLKSVAENLVRFSHDGSIHYLSMDWRHLLELLSACREVYAEYKNLCVWTKDNGGMGSLYRSKHELVAVFKNGRGPHINNVQLGRMGRYRTNVWCYAGVNSFRANRMKDLEAHPTVKPVAMVADAIFDCSEINGLILDPFGGSGTTILACERTQRRAAVMEIDPVYVDVAMRRFEKAAGVPAVHAETRLTFEEMRAKRTAEAL
jgi:DNA modification methylase